MVKTASVDQSALETAVVLVRALDVSGHFSNVFERVLSHVFSLCLGKGNSCNCGDSCKCPKCGADCCK